MKHLILLLLISLSFQAYSTPDPVVVVLPGNGTVSGTVGPQDTLIHQRQFYLIKASEMQKAGFQSSMILNAIGFTNALAPDSTSKGLFKVYLQNTNDLVSRKDTFWTDVTSDTNRILINGLVAGEYEWQIISCSGSSVDTTSSQFSTSALSACNKPTSINVNSIGTTTATINWTAPAANATRYLLQHDSINGNNWTTDTVNAITKNLTSLVAGKLYRYRVATLCGTELSEYAEGFFSTETLAAACNAPTSPLVTSTTGSTASLSWTAASGATRYDIQYRRTNTITWTNSISFSNTLNLSGLNAGTVYDWRIRTVCASGSGLYIAGPAITTTGTTVCYSPITLSADSLTDSTAVLTWNNTGATTYNIRYRVKNFISWDDALQRNHTDSMILVHNDSITIPNVAGPFSVAFSGSGTSPFTYNGNGLYVAFEYSHLEDSAVQKRTLALNTFGDSIISSVNGYDSLSYPLSFGSSRSADFHDILTSKSKRPETSFSSPSITDSVEISKVYTLYNAAIGYSTPMNVNAIIKNHTNTKNIFQATLTVKAVGTGTLRYTTSLTTDSISPDSSSQITFTGWSPVNIELDSIIVSVPTITGETYIYNNHVAVIQNVNSAIVSQSNNTEQVTSAGFDTLNGMLLAKYKMNGCGTVNSVQAYLSKDAIDHSVYGVILNSAGTIVDRSDSLLPDNSMVEKYHSFYFPGTPSFQNEVYYVGLVQKNEDSVSARPLGVQYDGTIQRDSVFYTADTAGAGLAVYPHTGSLMIRAEIIPSVPDVAITGKLSLCSAATNQLKAVQIETRYANKVLSFSTKKSGYSATEVLGIPNVYPDSTINNSTWISETADGQREYIVVNFPDSAPVNFINIYETFGAGAVDSVSVYNTLTDSYQTVYSGTAASAGNARLNHITFPLTAFNVSVIRIAINSPAVSGYYAMDAIATGKIDTTASANSYLWSTTATTQVISVIDTGIYSVTVSNAAGCTATASAHVYTPPVVTPSISASGTTTFCSGGNVILTSSQPSGNTWSTGATTQSITVNSAGSYSVTYNDGSGCSAVQSTPVTVTVNPVPVVNITGQTSICPGKTTTLSATSGFTSYSWATGQTTSSITVSSLQIYTVTVTNASGCTATRSVTTTAAALPSPTITGNTFFCPGSSVTLSTGSFSTYSWSTGSTSSSITASAAGGYSVTVTNASGCSATASKTIFQFTPPAPTVSGQTSFCQGASTTLSANIGYNTYSWNSGQTTRTITSNSAFNYIVTVTDGNGCTGTASSSTSFYPAPSPVITGDLVFCANSNTLLDAGISYAGYVWSTGATTHSISVNSAATFSVTVTDNNGCTGSSSVTTNNNSSAPSAPGNITGQLTGLCNATGKVFTVTPVANATSYYWTIPAGNTILSGQGTNSVTLQFNNFQDAYLSVVALNNCGVSAPSTTQIIGAPDAIGPISGRTDGVCRQNGFVYSISALDGATGYSWIVPTGATIVSGQGTTSITVNYGTLFSSGNVCVSASNACGVVSRCLFITAVPAVPPAIAGPAGVCRKAKNVVYTCTAVPGATTYNWIVPNGARVATGQGTTSITVNFSTTAGIVAVRAGNACGYSAYQNYPVTFVCREDVSGESLIEGLTETTAYPNPTSGKLNLAFTSVVPEKKYTVRIIDIPGKILLVQSGITQEGLNENVFDLSDKAKGIYFLNLEIEGVGTKTIKILVD
jgi:hypothetical protein